MTQICAPALPLAGNPDIDLDFDISHELAILYRLTEMPQAPRRKRVRVRSAWPSVAAIALALGWAGAAYAARATYTVAPGETLYQIAGRHLGSGARWVEIAALNDIKDPEKVQAGQAIMLPDRRERIATGASAARATAARAAIARRSGPSSRTARLPRTVRLARGVGQTQEGVPIVPAGNVVLELPARKVEVRPAAARANFARPVAAERVRPRQDAEIAAPLPAPPAKDPVSPWKAVDGAAFLLGALGVTGLLTRTRATRRNPQLQWQMAAQAMALKTAVAIPPSQPESNPVPDFWGPLQGTDLSRLAIGAPAR